MLKDKIKWAEKTVVITGGGSGIGKAVAIAVAKKGARVHLLDLRQERITAVIDELSSVVDVYSHNICGHTVDVTSPVQLEQVATTIQERVDILINCAGVLHQGKIATTPDKELHQVLDVNLWGAIYSIKAFLPQMRNRKQGSHIINIASIAGLIAAPEISLYNASKFAILGLTESLSIELAPENIHVAAVCPGSVNTNLCRDVLFSSESTDAQLLRRSVAQDIIQAIESSSLFKLSCVELHWQVLWLCKRLFPALYPKLASFVYHNVLDRGLLDFPLVLKTRMRQWL